MAEFGIYVDRQGRPVTTDGIVEWEGKAQSIAVYAPYILIFNESFIEVRHMENGRLIQVIRGARIRCLWNRGSEIGMAALPTTVSADDLLEELATVDKPRIYVVIDEGGQRFDLTGNEQVFEMIPVVALPSNPS